MKIVAFLQNSWFPAKSIATVKRAYEGRPTPEGRARLTRAYLFFRCLTGRRLKAAFGEELCDSII